jgi:hypothetical protein
MNRILDDEKWALGRDAIECEKAAARIWLKKRAGIPAPIAGDRRPQIRGERRWRILAVACPLLLLMIFLTVKWRDLFPSSMKAGPVSAFLSVLEGVQAEGMAADTESILFERAGLTDFAWSIQRVYCRFYLESEKREALPTLVERAFSAVRAGNGARAKPALREPVQPSRFSELFSRVYKSTKEG